MSAAPLTNALVDALAEDATALDRLAAALSSRLTPATAEPEPWLTVEGAAAHLACSKQRIYDLASQRATNGFPVHKDGSRSLFKASELDQWVRTR